MLINKTEQNLSKWAWGLHLGGFLIAVAGSALMLKAVVLPLREQDAELMAREADLREILDVETEVTGEHERLTRILNEADQKIKSLLDRIPNVPRESDFLGQITTLAKEVGVEIMDYHPGQISPQDEYHEMSLTITSQGDYEGVCNFLHRVHNLPRLSRANKLIIFPVKDRDTISLDMTLTIYFSPTSELASVTKEPNRG